MVKICKVESKSVCIFDDGSVRIIEDYIPFNPESGVLYRHIVGNKKIMFLVDTEGKCHFLCGKRKRCPTELHDIKTVFNGENSSYVIHNSGKVSSFGSFMFPHETVNLLAVSGDMCATYKDGLITTWGKFEQTYQVEGCSSLKCTDNFVVSLYKGVLTIHNKTFPEFHNVKSFFTNGNSVLIKFTDSKYYLYPHGDFIDIPEDSKIVYIDNGLFYYKDGLFYRYSFFHSNFSEGFTYDHLEYDYIKSRITTGKGNIGKFKTSLQRKTFWIYITKKREEAIKKIADYFAIVKNDILKYINNIELDALDLEDKINVDEWNGKFGCKFSTYYDLAEHLREFIEKEQNIYDFVSGKKIETSEYCGIEFPDDKDNSEELLERLIPILTTLKNLMYELKLVMEIVIPIKCPVEISEGIELESILVRDGTAFFMKSNRDIFVL